MSTISEQTVHRQRADAYIALARLADQYSLCSPRAVSFLAETSPLARDVDIQLDDNRGGSVRTWAYVLGLDEPVTRDRPASKSTLAYASVIAEAWNRDGPLWLGFDHIKVWSACRTEASAEYGREPDNGDPAAPVPPGVLGVPVGDSGPARHTGEDPS